jgi:hypothetical protein
LAGQQNDWADPTPGRKRSIGGQLVGIRIEENTLVLCDPVTRVVLRTRPNPLTGGASLPTARRTSSRTPVPATVTVDPGAALGQRYWLIMVCGQKIALGRAPAGHTLAVAVSETKLAIEPDDAETRVVRPHHQAGA